MQPPRLDVVARVATGPGHVLESDVACDTADAAVQAITPKRTAPLWAASSIGRAADS